MKSLRRHPPIEISTAPNRPLGMPASRFLRDYWQKRPLLIRGGFTGFSRAITPEDLAGLACEDAALARIVVRDPSRDRWQLRHGPFREADFARLPNTHWTLLVQDVDKWDTDVAALLRQFDFLPSWRIDDVMVSYASDGGGVGAHVDQYDVFLVQGRGTRRWRINTDPLASTAFRDDVELRVLRKFEPSHEWLLQPGDALYLPPGIAHEGTAVGECLTLSVGMRAPAQSELLLDLAEHLADTMAESQRYADGDLRAPRHAGEIDAAALDRVRAALPQVCALDNKTLQRWFGSFITRYRAAHEAAPPARALSASQLRRRLPRSRVLRNPWSRFAWSRDGRRALLFVAGDCLPCPLRLARRLCAEPDLEGASLDTGDAAVGLLQTLIDRGHLRLARRRATAA